MAIIAAAVIGGGAVALLGNNRSVPSSNTQQPVIQQPASTPRPGLPETTKRDGCLIKGNISSSGERIYHMPGQRYYDKTVIDTSKGERWLCTEQEAINAGWRRSKI